LLIHKIVAIPLKGMKFTMKNPILLALPILVLLSACGQAETPAPTLPPDPTEEPIAEPANTEPPPPTKEPTATAIPPTAAPPTATSLPQGVLLRDDFEGSLQPGWTWINEDPSRWSFTTGGKLEIVGDDVSFFMDGDFGMVNFLTRDLPDGEFAITTRVEADPDENFEQATIYIFENPDNYIALNIGYCGICSTNGPGFFMETYIDNNPFGNAYAINRDSELTDVLLKLENTGESLIGYYAIPGQDWQRVGAFGNFFDFNSVGLGATNSNSEGVVEDVVAQFDYFEISEP
jgi:hypothetical protein